MAILDADKEGFLRSETSLIQTIGRAARNVSGQVHMYADKITPVHGAGDRRDQPAPGQAGRLQRGATASTRSRCARGSPTSSTRCSREDADTDRAPRRAAASSRRGKAPVPGLRRPRRPAQHAKDHRGRDAPGRAGVADRALTEQMHQAAGRAAVRAGRPAPRRDQGAQEGAARHAGGRSHLTGPSAFRPDRGRAGGGAKTPTRSAPPLGEGWSS